jgi:hypothetical protein
MAKLTRIQRSQITSALEGIDKALAYINAQHIAVCHVSEINEKVPLRGDAFRSGKIVRSQDYENRDPNEPGWTINFVQELTPLDKTNGSDLARLYTAKRTLSDLLEAA